MSLDTETNSDTATLEHFGREWTIPAKRHLSHIRAMKAEIREVGGLSHDFLAELFLGEEQFDALVEIDPDEDALQEFGKKIAESLGLGDSGNS